MGESVDEAPDSAVRIPVWVVSRLFPHRSGNAQLQPNLLRSLDRHLAGSLLPLYLLRESFGACLKLMPKQSLCAQ